MHAVSLYDDHLQPAPQGCIIHEGLNGPKKKTKKVALQQRVCHGFSAVPAILTPLP